MFRARHSPNVVLVTKPQFLRLSTNKWDWVRVIVSTNKCLRRLQTSFFEQRNCSHIIRRLEGHRNKTVIHKNCCSFVGIQQDESNYSLLNHKNHAKGTKNLQPVSDSLSAAVVFSPSHVRWKRYQLYLIRTESNEAMCQGACTRLLVCQHWNRVELWCYFSS